MARVVRNIREQLEADEEVVLHEYKDHLGYSTLGCGRLIDSRKGGGITQEEAMYLLDNDISKRKAQVFSRLPWALQLSQARQGVLLNMAFQMGINGLLGFKNTLERIKEGNYNAAAAGMLASKWAQQTPERAARLAKQMQTDTWQ